MDANEPSEPAVPAEDHAGPATGPAGPSLLPPPLPPPLMPYPAPPAPPRIWSSFVLFAAVMAAMLALSGLPLLVILIAQEGIDVFRSPEFLELFFALVATPIGLISIAAVNVLILVSATLSAAWLSPAPIRRRLAWHAPAASTPLILLMAIVGIAVSWWLGFFIMWIDIFEEDGRGIIALMNQAFREADGFILLAMLLAVGVMVPVAEELLFRGYIQSRLQLRLGGAAAIAISSILFGILHMDPLHTPLAAIMGAYLGYIMLRTGSVWPPIIAHAAINIAAILSARFIPTDIDPPILLAGLLALTVLLVIGLLIIHRSTRTPPPTPP